MTRPIDAEELKAVFEEKSSEVVCGEELCKAIISRIDAAPTLEIEPHWIKVKKRLPEPYRSVYLTFTHAQYGTKGKKIVKTVGIGFHTGKKWSNVVGAITGYKEVKVLAWMPLPEVYEEVDEEQIN